MYTHALSVQSANQVQYWLTTYQLRKELWYLALYIDYSEEKIDEVQQLLLKVGKTVPNQVPNLLKSKDEFVTNK